MSSTKSRVGVLALQGAIEPHILMLKSLGHEALRVRNADELSQVDRLILPGGESSSMLRIIEREQLWQPLLDFGRSKPVWGICAGAILLAQRVLHPEQACLGLIEVEAWRNYYGSQLDSFSENIEILPLQCSMQVDFIRAPLLKPLSGLVQILAQRKTADGVQALLLRQNNILLSSFHTELGSDPRLHQYFCGM